MSDQLDQILRDYFSRVVSEAIEEHNGTIVQFAERSKTARIEAKTAVQALIDQAVLAGRIDEVKNALSLVAMEELEYRYAELNKLASEEK